MGPVIAFFAWFYLVPIALLVSATLAIVEHPVFQQGLGAYGFVISGVLIGAFVMASIGGKGEVNIVYVTIAFAVGGGVSGGTVASLIVRLRRLPNPNCPTPTSR
jgi:hypothetical protein